MLAVGVLGFPYIGALQADKKIDAIAAAPAAQQAPGLVINGTNGDDSLVGTTSDDTINGTGWVRCTAVTTVIEVHVRLIKDGVLLLPTTQTCYADDYCQRIVYSSPSGSHCWKTRAWGYWGQAMTPTGASTSTQFCWP